MSPSSLSSAYIVEIMVFSPRGGVQPVFCGTGEDHVHLIINLHTPPDLSSTHPPGSNMCISLWEDSLAPSYPRPAYGCLAWGSPGWFMGLTDGSPVARMLCKMWHMNKGLAQVLFAWLLRRQSRSDLRLLYFKQERGRHPVFRECEKFNLSLCLTSQWNVETPPDTSPLLNT